MESAVERYLRELASDSDRWQRLGRRGTEYFVDGLLNGLTRVGAISRDEASAWTEVLLGNFSDTSARFRSAEGGVVNQPDAHAWRPVSVHRAGSGTVTGEGTAHCW